MAVAIAATGALSGAHLNPAISLAMWLCRGFPAKSALAYMAAQLVGAVAGASLVLASYSTKIVEFEALSNLARGTAAAVASAPGCMFPAVGGVMCAWLEALQTAFLAFTVLSVTDEVGELGARERRTPPRRSQPLRHISRHIDLPASYHNAAATVPAGGREERSADHRGPDHHRAHRSLRAAHQCWHQPRAGPGTAAGGLRSGLGRAGVPGNEARTAIFLNSIFPLERERSLQLAALRRPSVSLTSC